MSATLSSNSYTAELSSIAAKLELPMAETDYLVNLVAADMLRSAYRYPGTKMEGGKEVPVPLTEQEKDINARVEAAYKKRYNTDFPPYRRKIRATALFGPPGHGKTTVFEVAARQVANDLGMRFLSPEQLEFVDIADIDHNTYVFVSQETAGVVSALEWMGLPSSEEIPGSKDKYMGRLFTLPLQKLMRAGAGTLLLDDYLNAARQIQDVGLSLVDRRRFGQLNLAQTYFGVTGNLGALDDTNATRASAALRNRMRMFLAHDTVENFIARIQSTPAFRDELGDAFIRMFLHRYPNHFSSHPKRGSQGGYTTPRSLRDFIDEGRDCFHRHGGRQHANRARQELVTIAQSTLGIDTANAYNAFLEAVLSKADPLAREIIMTGKISKDEIDKSYNEGGFSARETAFASQFAMALVDYTVHKIVMDDSMDEAIARFGKGVSILDESSFAFAMDELQSKLAAQVETVNKGKLVVSSAVDANNSKRRKLTSTAAEAIGQIILKAGDVDATRRATLISVLSEMNKHETRATAPGKRTRRS